MKNIIFVVVAILVVGGILITRALTQPTPAPQQSSQLPAGTVIYDVRTAEEFQASHVQTAQLLPVTDIQNGVLPTVAKDTPIALYCRSGHRAGIALDILKQAGFSNVRSLGGLTDLSKYGLKAE